MDDTAIQERKEFLSIAEAYIDKNLYKEASRIAESWLKRYPVDADANIIRCHALLKMGNIEKVGEILDDLETKVLELSRIYHRVGDLCLDAGLKKEAIKFYRKYISLNPAAASAKKVYEKVNALAANVDDPSAGAGKDADTPEKTARIGSDFCTMTLAELYLKQGHHDLALDVLGEILKKEPDNRMAADRLREIMVMRDGGKEKEFLLTEEDTAVIKELARWLENIGRLRGHAS